MNAIQIVTPAELAATELGFDTSILAGSLAASSMVAYAAQPVNLQTQALNSSPHSQNALAL
jgi:hypothetical protein